MEPVRTPSYDAVAPRFEITRSSEGRGWNHLQTYRLQLEPQFEPVATPIIDEHLIAVQLSGRCELTTRIDGRATRADVFPGSMSLMPSGVPSDVRWTHSVSMSHVHLSSALVATTAEDLGRVATELVPQTHFRDPFIEQVCLALVGELEATTDPLGALYVDTLAQALTLHLLRKHSTGTVVREAPRRGLSRRRLKVVVDYIEDRLASEISLDELASVAGLSPAYFSRQFKDAAGLPPHQYLIHRRVERAKELLRRGNLSIAEVSQAVGFFDQSHLNRHFKRVLKISPKDVIKDSRNVQG